MFCEYCGQYQRRGKHRQHRLRHAEQERTHSCRADGDAQHRAVIKAARGVHSFLHQRVRVSDTLARSACKRGFEFLAVGVILQTVGVGLGVVNHAAVRRYPRKTALPVRQRGEIIHAIVLNADRSYAQLFAQTALLDSAEIIAQEAHCRYHACKQHAGRREHDGRENFLCHTCASSR